MKTALSKMPAVLNFILAAVLVLTILNRPKQGSASEGEEEAGAPLIPGFAGTSDTMAEEIALPQKELQSAASLPFYQLYSSDLRQFAANLRSSGCPEETVRDILIAEVHKRHRTQEEAMRPKPADHLPAGWSPVTSERKLLERRQQAGALAARKAAMLREALGYEVQVEPPLYATSTPEQRFLKGVHALSAENRAAVAQAHEHYWAEVQALQDRTQGFWEPDDLAELERLKEERTQLIDQVLDEQQWTEFKLRTDPAVAKLQRELAMAEVNEDELRALIAAAREKGISELSAALSGGQQSTALLSAALGPERGTELSRLQQEPELRRFYSALKAIGVSGEAIQPLYDLRENLQQRINTLAQGINPNDPGEMNEMLLEINRAQQQLRELTGDTVWLQAQEKGLFNFPMRIGPRTAKP